MSECEWTGTSASSAGADSECPTRRVLPQVRESGEYAERGNELHEFARVVTVNPSARDEALAAVPEQWRHTAEGMNVANALDGLTVVGCEMAYVLNVQTQQVRFVGQNIGREYAAELARQGLPPLSKYDVPFTIDVEARYGDVPVELDYKSGQSIGDPAEHWQRRVCAMGLMLFHNTASAISRVAYIDDDGTITPDGCEFSALEIDDWCATLMRTADAVEAAKKLLASGVMPTVYPSDSACKYCPAMTSCPYYTNFAKAMLGKLQAVERGPELSELTPVELGQVWEMVKMAEKLTESILGGLKRVAAETPLPIGNKYEVRPQTKSKKFFNDSAARGLIVTLLGQAGRSDDEIKAQLNQLHGKTTYSEFRKLKVINA